VLPGRNAFPLKAVLVSTAMAACFVAAGIAIIELKSKASNKAVNKVQSVAALPQSEANREPGPGGPPPSEMRFRPRPELEEQMFPPPDEMRRPDDREFPQSRERGGRNFPSPLQRLPRPELSTIPDGPITTMLAQADAYTTEHPENFRGMVDRYQQIMAKARGTPQETQVKDKLEAVIQKHLAASQKALKEYEKKMDEKVRAGQPQAAYDLWKDFPQNLRTFESDQQINEILQRALPRGFVPK
jgi:hypothetical protein